VRGIIGIVICVLSMHLPLLADFEDLVQVNGFAKGFAITADSLGLESAYKNPAGLASLRQATLLTSYASQHDNLVQTIGIGLGLPLSNTLKIGLNIPLTIIQDNIETTTSGGRGVELGRFSNYEGGAILSVSKSLFSNSILIGSSATYRTSQLKDVSGSGLGLDAGIILHTPTLTVGASIQDIGNTTMTWDNDTKEVITPKYNIGFKLPLKRTLSIMGDMTSQKNKDTAYNVGVDYQLSKTLSLMGGIRDLQNSPTWRIGTALKVNKFQIHYAMSNHEDLGVNHKIGFTFLK